MKKDMDLFFFFKQKTAYEILIGLVGSEMCIRDRTDTVRNILKGEGVYLMKHLKGGVKKGAFDDAEAQKRFDAWKNGKDAKISAVREGDAKAKKEAAAKELEAEKKMNEAIAKKVADKKAAAAAAEEAPAEEAPAEA